MSADNPNTPNDPNDPNDPSNPSNPNMAEAINRLATLTSDIEDVLCDSKASMSECMMALSTVFVSGVIDCGVSFETAVGLLRKVYDLQTEIPMHSPPRSKRH